MGPFDGWLCSFIRVFRRVLGCDAGRERLERCLFFRANGHLGDEMIALCRQNLASIFWERLLTYCVNVVLQDVGSLPMGGSVHWLPSCARFAFLERQSLVEFPGPLGDLCRIA